MALMRSTMRPIWRGFGGPLVSSRSRTDGCDPRGRAASTRAVVVERAVRVRHLFFAHADVGLALSLMATVGSSPGSCWLLAPSAVM